MNHLQIFSSAGLLQMCKKSTIYYFPYDIQYYFIHCRTKQDQRFRTLRKYLQCFQKVLHYIETLRKETNKHREKQLESGKTEDSQQETSAAGEFTLYYMISG